MSVARSTGRTHVPGWRRSAAVSAVLVGAALAVTAPVATADTSDRLREVGTTTYELVPQRHAVKVTVVLTHMNQKPGYYYYGSTFWVERDATKLRVQASSGTASIRLKGRKGDWRLADMTYSNLNTGQKRKYTVTYELPAGGPRSAASRRSGYAYSSFCISGPGADTGRVRVILPAGYDVTLERSMRETTSGGKLVLDSGDLGAKPWTYFQCITGQNPKGYTTSDVPIDDATIRVDAWKEDKAWRSSVTAAVTEDYAALRTLLGDPTKDVVAIRESLDDISGFDLSAAGAGVYRIPETAGTREAATAELAKIWFEDDDFGPTWLIEGYAAWARRAAGVSEEPCDAAPTTPKPLDQWAVVSLGSPGSVRAAADRQRQAACHLVSTVADAIGRDRMVEIIGRIRAGASVWTADAPPGSTGHRLDWRTWLDLVTFEGLRPAEADPSALDALLVTYGIADGGTRLLAERRQAHDAYAAYLDASGDREPPPVVTVPMARWDFDAGLAAVAVAGQAWRDEHHAADRLADFAIDGGTVEASVAKARTLDDLHAAADTAKAHADLADRLAEAWAEEGRTPLQRIGLLGAALPDQAIVETLPRMDADAARTLAEHVRLTLDQAEAAGTSRVTVGVGIGAAIAAVLGVAWLALRRRSRSRESEPPGT